MKGVNARDLVQSLSFVGSSAGDVDGYRKLVLHVIRFVTLENGCPGSILAAINRLKSPCWRVSRLFAGDTRCAVRGRRLKKGIWSDRRRKCHQPWSRYQLVLQASDN